MESEEGLFDQIAKLATEQRNPATMNIDLAPVEEVLSLINAEDHLVAPAIREEASPYC